ncbi:LOW QUALITY PROTEIN: uncharacterized protein si:dkeyp-72a4.1 [Myxocyprinus asiaticus]|uniref:LOW QUALITY PROTEIN: uncharacterized protein si:dkeyp-72a4.1 n=1 Tax=Myxocyprinus asiaticus TaxID=70543 RepID=UPI0022227355|nr:LOW QUALITY PROTEIN: uncharacterized protein si:dkeyp-72a4.1 [Myxocyprinus asiaticus]
MQSRRNTMENPLLYSSQSQHHGWIQVSDMRCPPGHWMSYGHPCAEHAVWNPKFCVVTDYQMLLLDKEEIHPLLLQEKRTDTCKSRKLRRTISVPVETRFPEFQCHLSVNNSEGASGFIDSRKKEEGLLPFFQKVINKSISLSLSLSLSLSHFWPLGNTTILSALTGGVSLIIRPKTKEYVSSGENQAREFPQNV